ncbi:Proteasome activator complex subunit 4A [Lachnellula occidentalis]|uniref:Proteasome activator complex subunit 4A n=1 Tax=Lachnellula occidentalis TaxID=215460 RepID=A0A8H8UJ64_9HELO|nr:Proteasome activator complex subunit 4A [Lachnellula occidentalis]
MSYYNLEALANFMAGSVHLPKRRKLSVGSTPISGPRPRNSMDEGGFANGRSHAQFLQQFLQNEGPNDGISRATSPGLSFTMNGVESEQEKRYRPRTYPYFKLLPYNVEEEAERNAALEEILKQLYIAIKAEDITPGAVHWTRELKGWLNLKFEITRTLRVKLVKMYYMLSFAPGMDATAADRFESMFRTLLKRKHYLKPGDDLILDWRPLWKEIKSLVLPYEIGPHQGGGRKRSHKNLVALLTFAYQYFDPRERQAILDEIVPYFSTSEVTGAFIVMGTLNMLMPTHPAPNEPGQLQPKDYLPTYFHMWALVNRSKSFDTLFFDIFSRIARDSLTCQHVEFSEYGIFTKDQSDLIFTALLRLTEIPVGQASSPYCGLIDLGSGLGMYLEKDRKKNPLGYSIARWIVMSLSPAAIDKPGSILSNLEGMMESIDTFFHPSNQGAWTDVLSQLVFHLVDFFVMRWNREESGEMDTPPERRINDDLKKRFVLSLKEVVFMGLFSKKAKPLNYYFGALQGLSYLEPHLILPGALQRFYPSLQGMVEVHRCQSSLCGLQMTANVMSKHKGLRCHITALLALALPGIDANDLSKTQHTLNVIQAVAYSIPFVDLTKEHDDVHDTTLAIQWVQGEMERMEREGPNVQIDYRTELSDEDELKILRSSTAGFAEFVKSLLGKVFTLLENLPEASRVRSGSPEEAVINTLPAALTPLFAALSPEIFDMALEKVSSFVGGHVVHQARDAMAFICNALCKANPEKTLKVFVPMLIVGIRNEIDYNDAASDRSAGTDVLPRDRALVWHISMLSMIIVHVGDSLMPYKKELFDVALYMQEKCRGIPTIHVSNYIHHLLLNLTLIYPVDGALYEPEVFDRGINASDWGRSLKPSELTINWHLPSDDEITFAVELFETQVKTAVERLTNLISDTPSISRKGKNKEWSDDVSRNLSQLRLIISGVATLFDPKKAAGQTDEGQDQEGDSNMEGVEEPFEGDNPLAEAAEDEETRPQFHYRAGYLLEKDSETYLHLHKLREDIGYLLSKIHDFLSNHQEDDVACFTALYSAYRTWITDVGNERSAHMLERVTRLYISDTRAFKISGLRKEYPRPLLVKRAGIYHFQRAKHNSSARHKSDLDKTLLLQLADSAVSLYAEVRVSAQSALEAALKSLVGGRPLVIPPLLEKFKLALDSDDFDRIKGCLYTLLFGTLTRTISKDWRYAPQLVDLYIRSTSVDKASIQKVSTQALYGGLADFGKPLSHYTVIDQDLVQFLEPKEDFTSRIESKQRRIVDRRGQVESKKSALALKLTETSKHSHWKIAGRCTIFILNAGLRLQTLAPPSLVELVVSGAIDDHPGLRNSYSDSLIRIFNHIETRAMYGHSYEKYIREEAIQLNKVEVTVPKDNPNWTQEFLDGFAKPEVPEYYVDRDFPGWLVWGKSFKAVTAHPVEFTDFDEVESAVRKQIGDLLTRDWYSKYFGYMKQEPRDTNADRFRVHNAAVLISTLDLTVRGKSAATFEDIKELLDLTYEDGSDKHQHRAAAEIIAALLISSMERPIEIRNKVWDYAVPKMLNVFEDGLTPENITYWMTCLHMVIGGKDPRQAREIYDKLVSFRLDMSSNAAFKESSKVQLLEFAIQDAGWHFRSDKPILEDFLAHIDHPYKAVREAIGRTIAGLYRTRYYEAFKDVNTLLEANKASSSIGIKPYTPTEDFSTSLKEVFSRLEVWRGERTPGQQTPSSYTSGGKTVLLWLDTTLQSYECTQLLPFFPDVFMEQLLHMMDVKEDPELQRLAYQVYRHLPNIPFRAGEDGEFISALIRIGKVSTSWHQRLRTLINMQVIYFRRIFLIKPAQQQALFNAVADMLEDTQHEVRMGASTTLAGMIRCSPIALRDNILSSLTTKFTEALRKNPMPKKKSGTSTPINSNQQVIRRHAAVLGLGALVNAFPYATPPPEWMPEILAMLASRAANDAGAIGKTVKTILADFKKTRQDTWVTDQKYFTPEQLEDLEGVLWKSYFA